MGAPFVPTSANVYERATKPDNLPYLIDFFRGLRLDFLGKGSTTDVVATQMRLLPPPRLKTGALGDASAGNQAGASKEIPDMPRAAQLKTKSATFAQRAHASAAPLVVQPSTKAQSIISLLKAKRGATLAEMMRVTGWQEHSVRGFLAGALKKRHGLETKSEKLDDGPRRYRLR